MGRRVPGGVRTIKGGLEMKRTGWSRCICTWHKPTIRVGNDAKAGRGHGCLAKGLYLDFIGLKSLRRI